MSSSESEEEESDESALSPGHRLDRYELLCPVGEGGMARVWVARLARKYGFEKMVAIKTILQKHASDDRFRAMFLDEARIASRIDHPNVGHIIDLGEEGDVLYLVMEWIDGDTLSRIKRTVERKKQRFPLPIALRILADTCQGLHAAHELKGPDGELLGVVHRDVSPQNILVSMTGVAKLIDFGIAKARDRLSSETSTGFFKGKVHYISPEQAMGRQVDRRSDVFSIGAILFHLITGRPPFERDNQMATLHALSAGEPLPALPPEIPQEIDDILVRALAHSPDARFATAAELGTELERVMVSCNLNATSADVAAFLSVQLVTRAAARRRQIEQALKAAADREAAGLSPPTGSFPRLSSAGNTVAMASAPVTPHAIQVIPPPISVPRIEADVASASGAGTGGTGLQSVRSVPPRIPPSNNKGLVLAASSGLGVLALVGIVLAVIAVRARHAASHAQAALPPAAVASAEIAAATAASGPASASASAIASTSASTSTTDDAEEEEQAPEPSRTTAVPTASTRTPKPATKATAAAPPRTAAPATAGKKRIDDGF